MLLIGFLDYFQVPGREQINFLSWFVWAIPLVILFCGLAWLVVTFLGLTRLAREARVKLELETMGHSQQYGNRPGAVLFACFVGFWILNSLIRQLFSFTGSVEAFICVIFLVAFLYFTFHFRWPGQPGVLVRWSQLISEIPWRGLLFLGILLSVVALVHALGLDRSSAEWYAGFVAKLGGPFWIFFGTTLLIIFMTELFSNTVVSTAFFSIAYFAAASQGLPALPLMISVSIASTCAFMTPIATPCNALAFGEMRGTSLLRMMLLGSILNLGGALLMTFWLQTVIPLVYR
jgi:sodium-dependent dicarboxylate transporter 2/3/5